MPTYNRANTLMRMIESVLTQSFENFELIVVDDGSTDGTQILLQELQDERIKVFKKENGGVSSARNLGLQHAQGQYITFVDSDDYLLAGFFEDIYRHLEGEKYEILIYPMRVVSQTGVRDLPFFRDCVEYLQKYSPEFDGITLVKHSCLFFGNLGACAKIFRRSLLEHYQITYPLGIFYGEDVVFNLTAYLYASRVLLRDQWFYVYETLHYGLVTRIQRAYWQIDSVLRGHQVLSGLFEIHNRELLKYLYVNTFNHISTKYIMALLSSPQSDIDEKVKEFCLASCQFGFQKSKLRLMKVFASSYWRWIKLGIIGCLIVLNAIWRSCKKLFFCVGIEKSEVF